jgi:hypothetical protein
MISESIQSEIRLLSILHYVFGGLTVFTSLLPLIHIGMGIFMTSGKLPAASAQEAEILNMVGGLFIGIGSVVVLIGMICGICTILAGRYLGQYKNHTFCFIIACIECINVPLGTALGIYTIITLNKPEVKEPFGVV